ncbi:unnamed protein product [Arabis nemorensis]|uniref:Reverse transcriptase zinc-binding domain-containing protein n=1 Tax=Arabis nemorensis TaxID=586526 RepID=A0A565BS82_9BRAS|nr:unnamed protein product [Arabis nemorensis]
MDDVSGALAVADRLRSPDINLDVSCKLCQHHSETTCHVLFGCRAAEDMLRCANIPNPSSGFSTMLEENLSFMLDLIEKRAISEDTRLAIPWLLWNI